MLYFLPFIAGMLVSISVCLAIILHEVRAIRKAISEAENTNL